MHPNTNYISFLADGMCANRFAMQVATTMDVGGWVMLSEMAVTDDMDEAQLFQALLATTRGYFEFAACHDEHGPPGAHWAARMSVHPRWEEACHGLCHPTYEDMETLL